MNPVDLLIVLLCVNQGLICLGIGLVAAFAGHGLRYLDIEREDQPWHQRGVTPVALGLLGLCFVLWALLCAFAAADVASHGGVGSDVGHFVNQVTGHSSAAPAVPAKAPMPKRAGG